MRTCSVLLEPELAHEQWEEGLELTLEGFEDLHISLLGDCHCCTRFFDEDWSDDASRQDCSSHRALRRVQATNPLHSPECMVWAAISARGIIRPIFIEESGAAVTVTKERYVEVLKTFKSELQTFFPLLMSKFWFKQDGASSHTSNLSRDWLKENFRGQVISLKTDLEWAPYSPDLSPPDFFLWGYLEDRVYTGKPRTITELKEAIREEMRAITNSVC